MHIFPSTRVAAASAAVLILAAALPSAAADWSGSKVTRDGVPHMINPAEPMVAPTTRSPEVLWRAGGMDDEAVIFGVVTDITADDAGNLYLLDTQLNEVMVFSADGEYLRSIGREGEGPGEFRRPSGLFLTPDGNVAVLQTMPGRIVLMTPQGDPIGNHPVPETPDGGMMVFAQGDRAGDHIVLLTASFARRDDGMDITRQLVRINDAGEIVGTLYEQTNARNFASMSFDEREMQGVRWTCGPDGRVYVSDDFDAYRVLVYAPGGALDHVIEREYGHRKRSPEEKEEHKPDIRMRRGNHTERPETTVSETDRDILAMFPRTDGSLWVVSSRGGYDAAEGTLATFDVYDTDGRFEQQVTVTADADYVGDGIHFVGNRLYVVKGLQSAQRAAMGGGEELTDEELENAEPVSLICYDLTTTTRAGK